MAIEAQTMYPENLDLCYVNNFGGDESYYMGNNQHKHQQQVILQVPRMQEAVLPMKNRNNNNTSNGHNWQSNLDSIIEKNKQELVQLYNLQITNMRLMLQEQAKREISMSMQKVEMKMMVILEQKDEELVKVAQKAQELQNFIRKLEIENQAWQRLASDNGVVITNLNHTIEQLKEDNMYKFNSNDAIEDIGSCCAPDDKEETKVEYNGTSERRMLCRSCNARDLCVLFLPCRHLSSCQSCEPLLNSCPVCYMTKSCTIEAIMS